MKNFPVEKIIQSSMCIGCGGCADSKDTMNFNVEGIYQPNYAAESNLEGKEKLCPFNSEPKNGDKRSSLNSNVDNNHYHKNIGSYSSLYAGYSESHRSSSSSGGLSTWILEQLMLQGVIDKVICVASNAEGLYEYKVIGDSDELVSASHTKYFPVTLNAVLNEVRESNYTYAITGLPCFIHAVKLREKYDDKLKGKIKYKIGLFCGGYKTKFFTEYLSSLCGLDRLDIESPMYRDKKETGIATDYLFSVKGKKSKEISSISMLKVGDMWGTGLFKPEVCDYCEDISAELADVSIGDAWIPPYIKSSLGNNVVICRNSEIDKLIKQGISSGQLPLDSISEEQVLQSQRGNIAHRIDSLSYRLSKKKNGQVERLNTKPKFSFNIVNNLVQNQRSKVRKLSLIMWPKCESASQFDSQMEPHLNRLKILTKVNQYLRKVMNKLGL